MDDDKQLVIDTSLVPAEEDPLLEDIRASEIEAVPVTTGERLSTNFDNAFRTVQRQNVGIQLDVKPQVNSSGSIKLFLRQEVSSIAGPVATGSADLIINKREFKTVLTVDDGEILAIGGLLDENERRTLEKIPLLGDIPVVGELFKSREESARRQTLFVFLRPTILRTPDQAAVATEGKYARLRSAEAGLSDRSNLLLDPPKARLPMEIEGLY